VVRNEEKRSQLVGEVTHIRRRACSFEGRCREAKMVDDPLASGCQRGFFQKVALDEPLPGTWLH
jgi:hypothetical protein